MSVNTFYSRTADSIFLKFHIKLKALNHQNLRKPNFSEKWGKAPKFLKNRVFFGFFQEFDHLIYLFLTLKMEHYNVVYDSLKACCLGKAWSQNDTKSIRLQDSLIINIPGRS